MAIVVSRLLGTVCRSGLRDVRSLDVIVNTTEPARTVLTSFVMRCDDDVVNVMTANFTLAPRAHKFRINFREILGWASPRMPA